jgi:competence protein ComGF
MKTTHQQGFTILEMLITLNVLLVLLSLFPLLFSVLSKWMFTMNSLNPFELEVAKQQISFEIREAKEVSIESASIKLENHDNQTIQYEQYNNILRRRVNNSGHEVVLQRINSVEFGLVSKGVKLTIFDESNIIHVIVIKRWVDVINEE